MTSSFAFSSIMRLVLFQQGEWKQTKGGLILRSIAHEQRQECFCTLRDVQKLPTLLQNSMSESMFCCWAWAETQGKIGYKSHQISFQVAVALLHHAEVCQQPGQDLCMALRCHLRTYQQYQTDPHRCLLNRLVHKCYSLPTLGKY